MDVREPGNNSSRITHGRNVVEEVDDRGIETFNEAVTSNMSYR